MPNEITDAAARSAKASKTLDTMRARIVKADAARTEAAHQARAAQVKMIEEASPHTRGWTLIGFRQIGNSRWLPRTRGDGPFPLVAFRCQHAGMDPSRTFVDDGASRLPRTRGDGPRLCLL